MSIAKGPVTGLLPVVAVFLQLTVYSNSNACIIAVPSDQPTIQAGIDVASDGDTVSVAPGLYTGVGNRGIHFHGKSLVLKSESGAENTIIDCQASPANPARAIHFSGGEDTSTVIDGFTITGGWMGGYFVTIGAGILCELESSPIIRNCIITGNTAYNGNGAGIGVSASHPVIDNCLISDNRCYGDVRIGSGGGLAIVGPGPSVGHATPTIRGCVIVKNTARQGAGVYCWCAWPDFLNCTISDNSTFGYSLPGNGLGGGVYVEMDSRPTLSRSVVCTNHADSGGAVYVGQYSWARLTNCNLFNNNGGDWVGIIAGQADTLGNFRSNPRFCDPLKGDYHISNLSHCAPDHSPCGDLVGALGVGCIAFAGPIWHVAVSGNDSTGDGSLEKPFATIRHAVGWAFEADTILVHDGSYTGEDNRNIDFGGKSLVVMSANGPEVTILDCDGPSQEHRTAFYFRSGEDSTSGVCGFTIMKANHSAFYLESSSPRLIGNYLTKNYGSVIDCRKANPHIEGNLIFENHGSPGIRCDSSNPTIVQNLIVQNGSDGISCDYSDPRIIGNTIADNDGSGVYCYRLSKPEVTDCNLWGNRNGSVRICTGCTNYDPVISYCNLEKPWEGEGNISEPPLFLDPASFDYNICSQSPCVDAGSQDQLDPDGTRSDIGYFFPDHPDCPIGLRTLLHVDTSGNDNNGDGSANNPFRTIQRAINYSIDGDTVLVGRGIYKENLCFFGREILLGSNFVLSADREDINNTIIDGDSLNTVVTFRHGESRSATISGFTIRRGCEQDLAGGVTCQNHSSPTISNNIIENNVGMAGGLGCFDGSAPFIMNNLIVSNKGYGYCYWIWWSQYCGPGAGGIHCDGSSPDILNNTVADNSGGGISCIELSAPQILNTILWGNEHPQIDTLSSSPAVTFCDVERGWEGEGNVTEYPLFLAPSEKDYALCSQSPCIDAGHPDTLDPDGTRSDMGAYTGSNPDCSVGQRTLLYVSPAGSDVTGDGSPDNSYRTIQHAVNFALDSDTVLAIPGEYEERIAFAGKNILLTSQFAITGDYQDISNTIIISGAGPGILPATINVMNGEDSTTVVQGLTIVGTDAAVQIDNSSPTFIDNIIRDSYHGIIVSGSHSRVNHTLFFNNGGPCVKGGALQCTQGGSMVATNCTFVSNEASHVITIPEDPCDPEGAVVYSENSQPVLKNCLLAYNEGTHLSGPVALYCCDTWFEDAEEEPADSAGNFSADPLICNMGTEDFHISDLSPCAPSNNDCGTLIGAFGVLCTEAGGPVHHIAVHGNDNSGDGSEEYPFATIQRGIAAAGNADTVLVWPGTFRGAGNRDIELWGKNIVVQSQGGADVTTIQCEGNKEEPHRGFWVHQGEDSTSLIEGFTIRDGHALKGGGICLDGVSSRISRNIIRGNTAIEGGGIYSSSGAPAITRNLIDSNLSVATSVDGGGGINISGVGHILKNIITNNRTYACGGGIACASYGSAVLDSNHIESNYARMQGGGVFSSAKDTIRHSTIARNEAAGVGGGIAFLHGGDGHVSHCVIEDNSALAGGGISCGWFSEPSIENATIVRNSAGVASGLFFFKNSHAVLSNTIIVFGQESEAVFGDGLLGDSGSVALSCCNIYGNDGGDWVGCVEDRAKADGNFSADPLFCEAAEGNYRLTALSPCAPENCACGGLIGALGVGCTPTDVDRKEEDEIPSSFNLSQNFPNPFNPTTMIQFTLPRACEVRLEVFNILGQQVLVLLDQSLSAGTHTIQWDGLSSSGNPVSSGVYFYRLVTEDFVESKKMIMIK